MRDLWRWGGWAGIVAGVVGAGLFLVYLLVFPRGGLGPDGFKNPDTYLPFIAANRGVFAVSNFLSFLVSVLLAVALLAVGDRFRTEAPVRSRVGPLLGIVGATAFALGGLISLVGFDSLARLSAADRVAATHAFYALNGVADAVYFLGNWTLGPGAVLLGTGMLKVDRYRQVGYIGILGGVFVSVLFFSFIGSSVGFVLAIIWIVWTGLILRAEGAAH